MHGLIDQNKAKEYEGKLFDTNYGKLEVVRYLNAHKVYIKFINTGFECLTRISHILSGKVKDHTVPVFHGVGYNSEGKTSGSCIRTKYAKSKWRGLIVRGYCPNFKIKHPTYKDCYVCDEWKDFANFKFWFISNIKDDKHLNFAIDKDLLVEGNQQYHPELCSLIPQALNNIKIYDTYRNPHTGIETLNGYYRVYCADVNNRRVECGSTFDFVEAVNLYRGVKSEVLKKSAIKFKDVISERLFQKLSCFEYEEFKGVQQCTDY